MIRTKNIKASTVLKISITIAPLLVWGVINIDIGVITNNDTTMLWVHAPSTLEPGEEGELVVEAWDSFERLSCSYNGRVEFSLKSYSMDTLKLLPQEDVTSHLPHSHRFTGHLLGQGVIPAYMLPGMDNGMRRFDFRIMTAGVHYILVHDTATEKTYWSNPIVVEEATKSLVWGDIHSHSLLSDGSGMPYENHYFARVVAGLEFAAVTDHGENLHLDNGWSWIQAATNAANDPGEFVAFQGVEWTSSGGPHTPSWGYGHLTFIFSGDEVGRISADIQKTSDELWNYLDQFTSETGERAIAQPHHCVRQPFIQDWAACLNHPEYMRIAEAYSVHGSSLVNPYSPWNATGTVGQPEEKIPGSSINEALTMGLRLGFIANGDSHDGFLGHSLSHTRAFIGHQYPPAYDSSRVPQPYPSGLTGVFAGNITRQSIFDAIYDRATIANSDYGRPYLSFSINGLYPGENDSVLIVDNETAKRKVTIFIAQDGNPSAGYKRAATPWLEEPDWSAKVEVFKNGMLWREQEISTPIASIGFNDTTAIA
ncbi:MAG: DUF3604 domain-containing protein, partial [Promethearchaeati archaeon]